MFISYYATHINVIDNDQQNSTIILIMYANSLLFS